MSNTRWVTDARARGGRVLVKTLEYKPSAKKQKAKQEKAFALVPLARAAEVSRHAKYRALVQLEAAGIITG